MTPTKKMIRAAERASNASKHRGRRVVKGWAVVEIRDGRIDKAGIDYEEVQHYSEQNWNQAYVMTIPCEIIYSLPKRNE